LKKEKRKNNENDQRNLRSENNINNNYKLKQKSYKLHPEKEHNENEQ
jgi:hypothetical protein